MQAARWSGAGLEFAAAAGLGYLGGEALDDAAGTTPWFAAGGALLGIAAGTWLLLRPLLGGAGEGPGKEGDDASGRPI